MKLFTISNNQIESGIAVNTRKSQKTGDEFNVILVGQDGRGSRLSWVPLHPTVVIDTTEDQYGRTRLFECRLGDTKSGGYLVLPSAGEDNRALILLYFQEGYRGQNSYALPEHGCTVISEGRYSQGAAGRMGGGTEYLLLLEPGAVVTATRTGRLYGGSADLRVEWDGHTLAAFHPEDEPAECDMSAISII